MISAVNWFAIIYYYCFSFRVEPKQSCSYFVDVYTGTEGKALKSRVCLPI
jgi:hypothetical protein